MVDFAKLLAERRERHNIENRPQNTKVSISVAGPDYAIKFPKDDRLTKALKDAIPASERNWHRTRYVWLIHPDELKTAIDVIIQYTNQLTLPAGHPTTPETIEKSFLLEYLGATKDRGKKTSAYGSVNGEWSVEITEDILRGFFEGREVNTKPDGLQTLYQALCVFEKATSEEIGKAYKRLARQWHPDVCREENAHEMFIKINEAYKILINPEMKRRYDAGLYFERQGQKQDLDLNGIVEKFNSRFIGYRSPLRCGQITARGTVRLMRFTVQEIIKWDDVVDAQGKVMTSAWPKGADAFQILWV